MNGFAFDKAAKFRAQRLFRHQIDRAAEQIFEIKLHAEIAFRCGGTVEGNEDVDIAAFVC